MDNQEKRNAHTGTLSDFIEIVDRGRNKIIKTQSSEEDSKLKQIFSLKSTFSQKQKPNLIESFRFKQFRDPSHINPLNRNKFATLHRSQSIPQKKKLQFKKQLKDANQRNPSNIFNVSAKSYDSIGVKSVKFRIKSHFSSGEQTSIFNRQKITKNQYKFEDCFSKEYKINKFKHPLLRSIRKFEFQEKIARKRGNDAEKSLEVVSRLHDIEQKVLFPDCYTDKPKENNRKIHNKSNTKNNPHSKSLCIPNSPKNHQNSHKKVHSQKKSPFSFKIRKSKLFYLNALKVDRSETGIANLYKNRKLVVSFLQAESQVLNSNNAEKYHRKA